MQCKNLILTFLIIFSFERFLHADNFVSIKSKANLRAGPGKQYPINWTLNLQGMPVKIIESGKIYSKIELYDGTIGWIWNATISDKKRLLVIEDSYIYNKSFKKIAIVKKRVVLERLRCNEIINNTKSCKVSIDNLKGYIKEQHIWGVNK